MQRLLISRCYYNIGKTVFCKKFRVTCINQPNIVNRLKSTLQEIDPRPGETHDDKNARLKRPLSPHLSIYRPQYTSILSILHRISGTVFSAYVLSFACCALFLPYDFETVMQYVEDLHLPNSLLLFGKFCMAAPIFYHACNGIRHLLWDTASFMDLKSVKITGAIMVLTAATTLTIALIFADK